MDTGDERRYDTGVLRCRRYGYSSMSRFWFFTLTPSPTITSPRCLSPGPIAPPSATPADRWIPATSAGMTNLFFPMGDTINNALSVLHSDTIPNNKVTSVLVTGGHFSAMRDACGSMDTGDKRRYDTVVLQCRPHVAAKAGETGRHLRNCLTNSYGLCGIQRKRPERRAPAAGSKVL